jgi:hypothetical protein
MGQCTLSGPVSDWNAGTGNWSDGSDWNGGVPNSSTQSVCITNGTLSAPSVVNLNIDASINNLQIGTFDTLNFDPGTQLTVYGTQIINAGQININSGGGANALLELANNVTLSGAGTLTLSNSGGGGAAIIYQSAADLTLTNQSTIDGAGTIGFNGLSLINQGTIDANASGQSLVFSSMTNGINNAGGLLEATNGGILNLDGITVAGGGTITATTGGTVQLVANTDIVGGTLNNIGGTLGTPNGNSAFLDGSTGAGAITINGTYTNGLGSTTYILGTINNNNNFQMNAGGGDNSVLIVDSHNLTLQGGGTITMSNSGGGGADIIYQEAAGSTLTNVNNTIQGAGTIGFNGLSVVNEAVINANLSGQTLTLDSMTNGLNNTGGTLEASNGGTLLIDGVTVNNSGANITANAGSTVQLIGNTIIQGGTLTNNGTFLGTPNGNAAFLDGSTSAGAITINGTYTNGLGSTTYILGTINNNNNFQLNAGGGANSVLEIDSANLTLQGGGTVTLSNSGGGGSAIIYQAAADLTLTNVNNTIEGTGTIGFNGLTVVNEATIDANVSGQTLTLDSMTGGLTNTGIVEASNGGTLYIDAVTVNNAGGNITANAGSTVQLVGNTTIQGGTLTNNGAFFGTPDGNSAILDGSTAAGAITINGTYTNGNASITYLLGTINNNNNFLVTATGNGNNSELEIDSHNVTLQGGGTVTLSTGSGSGDAILLQAAGGLTLTNVNNTIQGEGIIGFNGLTLVNESGGTINANSTGGSLINTLTIESASVTNQGYMDATNNGTLYIDAVTIDNHGGNIAAIGAGASVELVGQTDIQGGTLTNNGGAFFGTPNGNQAILDGSTAAGAVTINGTYTNGNSSITFLLGTINNQGNILLNGGSGNNSDLEIDSANVTLTGGGTVTMSTASGSGNAEILQAAGGLTLENFNNTIQGAGIIGENGLSLLNDVAGTILANAFGQTLTLSGGGSVTNNGTFQVNAGSELLLSNVTFTNFAGHTLTGGTYDVYGTLANPGTLQIDPLGSTGGEIVNNAATILLSGPNSNVVDNLGLNALSNFSNNEAAGSFTIQDGRDFTSSPTANFSNAGIVNIGSGSTFTTGGVNSYVQTGGTTQLDGNLVAGSLQANFNGGTLYGNNGTITGNVTMAGIIVPAAAINGFSMPTMAGTLNIIGNYTQTATGIFNLGLGGTTPGTQFGLLNISGNALLNGTLDVSLINGFTPTVGESFTFINTGGSVSSEFASVNGLNIGGGLELEVIYGLNYVELTTEALSTTDLWLGGADTWTTGSKWSIGVPTQEDDVIIYSGVSNDLVTLNVSPTINSLTIGGPDNGFTSELTDGGTAQTLTITNALTVGQQGTLLLTGGSTVTAGADSTNAGLIDLENASSLGITGNLDNSGTIQTGATAGGGNTITVSGALTNEAGATFSLLGSGDIATVGTLTNNGNITVATGATLNLTGQPNGITDAVAGSDFELYGSFTTGGSTPGFASLNSVEGTVNLYGQSFTITPGSGTLTIASGGQLAADYNPNNGVASNITIAGNVTNSGTLATGFNFSNGGNNLDITGNLNNEGGSGVGFGLFSGGDTATVGGSLTNSGIVQLIGSGSHLTADNGLTNNSGGFVDVESGSTLTITGDVTNSSSGSFQGIYTNYLGDGGSNTITISGMLTNGGTFQFLGPGDHATIGSVTNNAGGFIDVEGGSTLDITGNVINNAAGPQGIYTSFNGTGNNTIDIGGTLTNNGKFGLESTGDQATITGAVTNNSGALFALTGGSKGTFESGLTNNAGAQVDLENASKLTIDGDVTNGGTLSTSDFGGTGGNTLTITGMLTNSGTFDLLGAGDTASIGNGMSNSGTVDVENGSTLAITGNVINSGDLYTDFSGLGGNNTLTINGTLDNTGLVWLRGSGDAATVTGNVTNELDAELFLYGGSKATMPGLSNAGTVDVEGGSTLQVNGAATNSGNLYSDELGNGGGNNINITGLLTNSGDFELYGPADTATLGGLTNSGTTDVEHGSTLTINGNVINSGDLYTDFSGLGGNNTININGTLDNTGLFWLRGASDTATITGNVTNELDAELFIYGGSQATMPTLNNAGTVDVEGGSSLSVTGAVTNSGNLFTNELGNGGNNTITVGGLLTNTPTGIITLNGSMDMLQALAGIVNSGTINVNNGSTIDPPFFNNLGTLNIDSTSTFIVGTGHASGPGYIQLANGTLGEMISSSAFGVINVNGSALLNGTLDVLLQGGYDPSVGSSYKFLLSNANGINGVFSNIENDIFNGGTEKWGVIYDSADGYVELLAESNGTPVPEPGTLLVLIPALFGAGFVLRRQLFR